MFMKLEYFAETMGSAFVVVGHLQADFFALQIGIVVKILPDFLPE